MTENHPSSKVFKVGESATATVLGYGGGAKGDVVEHIIIVPKTSAPGLVTLLDDDITYPLYYGGMDATLRSWTVVVDLVSRKGEWKITTGAHVEVICVGRFT